VIEKVPGYPVLVSTIVGTEPHLPSIALNSHFDVVPVMPEKWQWDPFSAEEVSLLPQHSHPLTPCNSLRTVISLLEEHKI